MSVNDADAAQLRKIIAIAQALLERMDGSAKKAPLADRSRRSARTRRSGKELAAFRKMLKSERKAGVPVAQLAKKHGISASYIYQLD